jgi:hypothetical protein
MKQVVLVVLVLFPLALAAQVEAPSPTKNPIGGAISIQADTASDGDDVSSSEPDIRNSVLLRPNPNAWPPLSARPRTSTKPRSEPKPKIPGSMVGYIDNAIVGSEIRLRMDAGFHDSAPDRAEYFYPQCACDGPGAPGPDFPGASNNVNFQQIYLEAEYAPVSRFSIFTEVPFRGVEPQPNSFIANSFTPGVDFPSLRANVGISDVRAGIKLSLAASYNHALTFQLRTYFPSGNGSRGLGTDHYAIEPSLLYYQRLSTRWAVESQIGDWHPFGGSLGTVGTEAPKGFAGDVFFYGIGPSYQLISRESVTVAPVVELFGWYVIGGLQSTIIPFPSATCGNGSPTGGCSTDAGGTNIINLKAGVRTSFGDRNSVYVGFGQAVTHSVWYEHIVRAEYRYTF